MITPVSYIDTDFGVYGKLYVGAGESQYEVGARFDTLHGLVATAVAKSEAASTGQTNLSTRISTLETEYGKVNTTLLNHLALENPQHVPDATGHGGKLLGVDANNNLIWSSHPSDMAKHLPAGGLEGQILGMLDGVAQWITAALGGGGGTGNVEITADSLFKAMVELIAMNWEADPNTPFNHPPGAYNAVRAGVYGNRFVFVGNKGTITWSYRGNIWWPADNKPFGEADIYSICYGADETNRGMYMTIDSSNQFSFSWDGRNWMNAMSHGTTEAAFRCACYGNQTFIIFGRRGTILRATFSQYQNPWITDANGNRTGIDWQIQNNSAAELEGLLCCCFGLGHFVAGGELGKIIRSKDGANWTIQNMTPFESSSVQAMAFGNGRIVAAGQNGKIAMTTDPDVVNWKLIEERPFGTETAIYSMTFGGGLFVAADYYGRIATSSDGEHWKLWFPYQMEQSVIRAIAYGNMSIVVGNDNGVLSVSDSISKRFTNFDRGEFLEYVDENKTWFAQIEAEFAKFLPMIEAALAHKPDLGTVEALPQSLATDSNENAIWYVGTVGVSPDAAPIDHQHPSNLAIGHEINSRPLSELGTAGTSNMAARYDHEHTWAGMVLLAQVGVPGGVTPLDGDGLIPLQFMRHGWDWAGLYSTLNAQNISRWYIQPNPMFQDIVSDAIIYAAASNTRAIVVVGEKGRIAYGSHIKRLKRAENQPFDDRPCIAVACGCDYEGADLFIAVDTTNRYALSRDGEFWSEPFEFPDADIEGIMYGGGRFLIWCSNGTISRSTWSGEELVFVSQSSTPLDAEGIRSIVFHNRKYVGVGVDGKAITSPDADGWELETTPEGTPTLLHAFAAENEVVAVGLGGTIISTADGGKTWTQRKSGRTEDFYAGYYYDGLYLVAGKNGTLISSENLATGFTSPYATNISSIIRVVHRHAGVFILCSDAGQIAACATFAEILGMIFETDTLAPYNDLPLPLQELADPGISNRYARGDHVHPCDGLVTVFMVGAAGGVASLDEKGHVPDEQLAKGEPDGGAPLDGDGLVPKRHLPPFDVNVVIEAMKNNLEFVEMRSCFQRGPGVSSILHDATEINGTLVMVGEAGIGFSRDVLNWTPVAGQPFEKAVISVTTGIDPDGKAMAVAIDTHRSFSVSRNGIDWSEKITLDGDYDFSYIAYYNRTFIIACSNGPVLRSVWNEGTIDFVEQEDGPEFTRGLTRVVGGNGLYVGVGNGGMIRASADASHFEPVESPTTKNLYVIAHGKATFVAGGEGGELIVGDGLEFKVSTAKPFKANADIMGLSYIESTGTFIATNRAGEIAVSTDLEIWAQVPSTSSTSQRAIASGLDCIILGDDLGEIAASRKVFEFGDIIGGGEKSGGNVSLVRSKDDDERAVVRLIGRTGAATGKTLRNAILLQPGKVTIETVKIEI